MQKSIEPQRIMLNNEFHGCFGSYVSFAKNNAENQKYSSRTYSTIVLLDHHVESIVLNII